MPPPILFVLSFILLGIALFGLLRLTRARQGTDEDWQALVAFGRVLPYDLRGPEGDPARWAQALAAAPPGILPPGPGDVGRAPSSAVVYERMRAHQAMLQAEMKWFAHRLPNPLHWFHAGVRGLLLLPLGLALDLDAAHRARRRAMESHADFQRAVSGLLGVVVFSILAGLVIFGPETITWLERLLRE